MNNKEYRLGKESLYEAVRDFTSRRSPIEAEADFLELDQCKREGIVSRRKSKEVRVPFYY